MEPELEELIAGFWALTVGGWDVVRASLYDEEGVEGWRWDGPNYEEIAELGDWQEPPPVPDRVIAAWKASCDE
jgi:hypothetical protein